MEHRGAGSIEVVVRKPMKQTQIDSLSPEEPSIPHRPSEALRVYCFESIGVCLIITDSSKFRTPKETPSFSVDVARMPEGADLDSRAQNLLT